MPAVLLFWRQNTCIDLSTVFIVFFCCFFVFLFIVYLIHLNLGHNLRVRLVALQVLEAVLSSCDPDIHEDYMKEVNELLISLYIWT